jgi:hypothetical protein
MPKHASRGLSDASSHCAANLSTIKRMVLLLISTNLAAKIGVASHWIRRQVESSETGRLCWTRVTVEDSPMAALLTTF